MVRGQLLCECVHRTIDSLVFTKLEPFCFDQARLTHFLLLIIVGCTAPIIMVNLSLNIVGHPGEVPTILRILQLAAVV